MSQPKSPEISRRIMFAGVGTAGALAAAAVAIPLARTSTNGAAPAAKVDEKGDGYQVTAHVLQYYQTARV